MRVIKYLAIFIFVFLNITSICHACKDTIAFVGLSEQLIGEKKTIDWCLPNNIIIDDKLSPGYAFYKANEKWFIKYPTKLKEIGNTEQDWKNADEFFREKAEKTSKKAKKIGNISFIVIKGEENDKTHAETKVWYDQVMKTLLGKNARNMAFDNEIIDMYSEEEGNNTKIVLNNKEIATLQYDGTIKYSSGSPFPIFIVRTQEDEERLKNVILETVFFQNLIPTPANIKSVAIQTEQIINKRLLSLGLADLLHTTNINKLAIIKASKKPYNTTAFIDNLSKSSRNNFKHFGYSDKTI